MCEPVSVVNIMHRNIILLEMKAKLFRHPRRTRGHDGADGKPSDSPNQAVS